MTVILYTLKYIRFGPCKRKTYVVIITNRCDNQSSTQLKIYDKDFRRIAYSDQNKKIRDPVYNTNHK